MRPLPSRLTAEALGTFALIYFGCGAVVVSGLPGAGFGLLGVALTHAVVFGVMISATMAVSGGHLNPAITLGLLSIGKVSARDALAYVVAQLAGGVLGALVLKHTLPTPITAIGTLGTPALSNATNLATGTTLEAVLTFFLMSAVMGTAVHEEAPRLGGFAIGLVLLFGILVGGTFTGAAMNPARAFGPAVVSGTWYAHPVWWVGPIVGAVLAAQLWGRVILSQR